MLDSICIVSTHFCMLPHPTQRLIKCSFITVDDRTQGGILACIMLLTLFV